MNPFHLFSGGGSQGVEMFTWGRNDGKVKLGRQVKKSAKKKPKSVQVLNGTRPLFVQVGEFHSFVIANEGRDVYGWGKGNKGQLGRGDTNDQSIPRLVSGLRDRRIIKLSCGVEHSLAISSDGFLYSFGSNSKGQLGTGSSNQFSCIPEVIKGKWGDQRIINIACGNVISSAITEEGELYEWGDVSSGLLGNGSEPYDFYNPVKSVHFTGVPMSSISFGINHWIALTREGFVYAFGDNKLGQLGITSTNRVMDQAELVTALKGVVQIATGHHHSVALCENGELYCFGDNSEGQLGMGDKKTRFVPTKVRFPPSFLCDNLVSVCAGSQHTICLTKSGRTFGWGNNHKHQISAGLKRDITEPCLISGLRHQLVKFVSAGGNSSAAMTGRMAGKGGADHNQQQQHIHFGYHAITIAIGTFNINGQKASLSKKIIREWLLGYNQPDIIVVGITELVKLSGREVAKDLVEIESNAMRIYFESQFEETLNEKHHLLPEDEEEDYVQLFSKSLVGTMLCIYTKKKIRTQITDLAWDQARVGIMGKMANKGAVSARFSLHESQLCFVASHLAAGQSKVEKRNLDYAAISSKLRFSVKNSELTIFDHENIFWCGDLNYRLTGISKEDAINAIKKGALEELWAHDQLLIETQAKRIFLDFNEGKLNFPPTYKYDLNSNVYDTSEKQRVPSWCDRILWRGDFLMQLDYSRHEIFTSDHCPVSGLFRVIITKVEKEGEGVDSASDEEDSKPLAPRMDPNEKRTQILMQSEHISSLSSSNGTGDTEKEILKIRSSTEKSGEFPKPTSIVIERRVTGAPNSLLRDTFEKDMEKKQRRLRPHSIHLPGSNYREIDVDHWKSYNEACEEVGIDDNTVLKNTVVGDVMPPLFVPLEEIQEKSSNGSSTATSPISLPTGSMEGESKSIGLPVVSPTELSHSLSPPKSNFSVRRYLRDSGGGSDKKSPPEKHHRGSLPGACYRMEAKSLPSSPRVSPRFRTPNQINAEVTTPYKSKEGIVFAAGEDVKIMGSETIEGQDWVKVETKNGEQGMIPRLRVKILESKENAANHTSSTDSQESIKLSSVTVSIDDPWIIKQGYLVKRGSIRKNWKSRFFVLTPANLSYYHSQHSGKIPLGVWNIWEDRLAIKFERSVVIDKSGTPKNIFIIKGTHRKDLHIDAGTSIEMESWITALESVVNGNHRHLLLGKFTRRQEEPN
eukprot:TRINITY_DN4539_c0_g1_i2.p1 TRINITY_DN4539_c0_g1~~TRINITY_DN4539_c0_g1_i2.p1  ORF type:complete len:1197 (-),score=467.66 TRINITY_DN4539_c0_g1_i2:41-3631(-)